MNVYVEVDTSYSDLFRFRILSEETSEPVMGRQKCLLAAEREIRWAGHTWVANPKTVKER